MKYICKECGTAYEQELGGCPVCRKEEKAAKLDPVHAERAQEFWRDAKYTEEKYTSDR